jgi:micrococcal nuclease
MKKILFGCTLLFISLKGFSQTSVPAKEAAKHLNEKVTICDKVYGGKFLSNAGITLIDIGGSHPNEALTLLIKGDDRKKFKTPPEELFKDKKVCITGTVIDYKGKPEIVITEAEQIKIVE